MAETKNKKYSRNSAWCANYKNGGRKQKNKLARLVTYLNRNHRKSLKGSGIDQQARNDYKRLTGCDYNEQWARDATARAQG